MGIAYDRGVNFFDNAETYALGESEKMMGRVLKEQKLGSHFIYGFFKGLFWLERKK